MKLRPARPDDLAVLLEIEQGVIEEERPYNDSIRKSNVNYYDLNDLLNDPSACLQVVECDGRIVGCGYVQLRPSKAAFVHHKHAYLGFMYVESDFRGREINKMIIESLIEWSKDRGVHDFYLDVYAGNQPAIRAYEKAGFTPNLVEMKLSLNKL